MLHKVNKIMYYTWECICIVCILVKILRLRLKCLLVSINIKLKVMKTCYMYNIVKLGNKMLKCILNLFNETQNLFQLCNPKHSTIKTHYPTIIPNWLEWRFWWSWTTYTPNWVPWWWISLKWCILGRWNFSY